MKKKWGIFSGVLLLLLALTAVTVYFIKKQPGQQTSGESKADSSALTTVKEEEYHSSLTADKTETVQAKADPEGNVREITVEAALKNPGGAEKIPDYSILQDVKNTKGDEEFTRQEDGTILWDNHGEDIYYQGTASAELPISVHVSYYLNGQPVKPEEIAGKSGQVQIRFDYENHTSDTVQVDGKDVSVQIPFAVCSAVLLPSDTFYNIEVTNGKVLSMEDQNLAVGYACPGLMDSLKLSDYKPTEDVEIPDYVEITADTSCFELEFTAIVVSSGLLEDMDTEDLEDVDDLIADMKELTDASKELVDGTAELFDGVAELQDGIKEYTDGVRAVDEGIDAVKDGLDQLNDQKTTLREGALALQTSLETLDKALAQITLPEVGAGDSSDGSSAGGGSGTGSSSSGGSDGSGSTDSGSGAGGSDGSSSTDSSSDSSGSGAGDDSVPPSMDPETAELYAALASLRETLNTLKTSVHQLAEGSKQLTEGVQAYTHGVSLLYRGSVDLSEGSTELWEASAELNDGLAELVDGVQELRDGVQEFDEEGIQNLAKLAGDDLETVIRQLRALKKADERYSNFSGLLDGQTGEVRFIIETDEISF